MGFAGDRMNPPKNGNVSVVILTKNSALTLERCLKSVIDQKPREVLAVHMLSTDRTLTILERYGIRVVRNPGASLGYSRQLGVESAEGDLVMFVDSDIALGHDCIRKLRYDLEKYNWAGIHAMILSRENVTYWQRAEDENFAMYFNRVGPTAHIGTGAAMFRRDVLLRYPFDANLTLSSEDIDVCVRLGRDGYRVGVSSAVAYHFHRRDFLSFARRRFSYGLGDAQFAVKYGVIREKLADDARTAVSQTFRSILTGKFYLVPYWVTSHVASFLGLLVGLSRMRWTHYDSTKAWRV
jgi:glycosyltransferase involved in cell wall biosynthesis